MAALTIEQIEILLHRGDYVNLAPDGTVTIAPCFGLKAELEALRVRYEMNAKELAELRALLNVPETEDFDKGVPLEAAHQIMRWGAAHDAGKAPEDWFWLCGFLAGKALAAHKAGDVEKAMHHCISTTAVMRNWHAHIATGQSVTGKFCGADRPKAEEEKAVVSRNADAPPGL